MTNFKRYMRGFLIGVAILLLLLVLFVAYLIRNSFPQLRGQIRVAGLKQPVRIYRDAHGIPQIYASTQHDLFMAQGFVHAQDRFWQMDIWRHIGAGRLSEIFGKSEIKTDRFLRTLGWSQISEQELKMLDWNSVSILQDYASGVNAYLSSHGGSSLSFEYAVVKLLNSRYSPELWHPVHTLTWAKVMSFDLSMNMDYEINRARLLKTLSPAQVDELYPPYPSDNPVILPNESTSKIGSEAISPSLDKEGGRGWLEKSPALISDAFPFVDAAAENSSRIGSEALSPSLDKEGGRGWLEKSPALISDAFPFVDAAAENSSRIGSEALSPSLDKEGGRGWLKEPPSLISSSAPFIEAAAENLLALRQLIGINGESAYASNNWVISGKLTSTGKPILANDPHLGEQIPSIWYQIGLHCTPRTDACPFDVAGFSFAGVPGVIIGHNDRLAWGFTNVGPDVMDLYIEKVDPQNPNRYESNGRWVEMKVASDTIQVANDQPAPIKIRQTIHGPIISDSYSRLKNFDQSAKLPFPQPYAISLRWTALEPSRTFPAIWKMNVARTWSEFRAAAAQFDVPSQNMVYADVDGNIGYQMPGRVPIRNHGDGRYPVPGWTDEYAWKGYIPFDQLPTRFNPTDGFVATANNPVTDSSYPYLITQDWDYGFRARRIVELVRAAKGFMHPEYAQNMQNDNKNFNAQFLVPLILKLPIQDPDLTRARELLKTWNFQQNRDSAATALFETFWKYLLIQTMQDDLPEWFKPSGGSRWVEVFRKLTEDPNDPFWDNNRTKQLERRDDILQIAFAKAVHELQDSLGRNPEKWKWGTLHTTTFHNQTLGKSGLRILEELLNRGPFPTSGGTAVVNATGWDASESFEVTDLPSMRMIVDFSNFDQSMTVNTTGQSGHAFQSNYVDLAEMWRDGKYYPMYFTRKAVEENSKNLLLLVP